MSHTAFIVRPFGAKRFNCGPQQVDLAKRILEAQDRHKIQRPLVKDGGGAEGCPSLLIDFDAIDEALIQPALRQARIRGATTGAVIEAGNIREDMFNRLITADLVVADVSLHNPNVYYELGLRQAFRDKFTFVIRADLDLYPFDLQTDRYFEYELLELLECPRRVGERLAAALRRTINQYRADSPVFKLLPQLEAEDRSRFLSVPEDFREEVERARLHRDREYLSLLGLECEEHLWEIEGLRVVGRAQFEANFIEGAKRTWERIASRYPDDSESNTVLSTVYQRLSDRARSDQALARASRVRVLTPARQSELRSLSGRNLKARWIDHWSHVNGGDVGQRGRTALESPLLQKAIDSYVDAFKCDLNNSYAGLNALTLIAIQAELIGRHFAVWIGLQRKPEEAEAEARRRYERIDQLAQALELAVESDRERLAQGGEGDPWFSMLEAGLSCITSDQPEYVAQLYAQAKHDAPLKSDEGMVAALRLHVDLGICGELPEIDGYRPRCVGTLGRNVEAALAVFGEDGRDERNARLPKRILVFVGSRLDGNPAAPIDCRTESGESHDDNRFEPNLPTRLEARVRELIEAEINEELADDPRAIGMAGGAAGGDLLFHEICRERGIATQLFLAMARPQYIGEYVALAGERWVSRFAAVYAHVRSTQNKARELLGQADECVRIFSDICDLPRWLQDREHYDIGRRCMLWMLLHAQALTQAQGDDIQITLIALRHPGQAPGGFGDIEYVIRRAQMHGVKVRIVNVPVQADDEPEAVDDRAEVLSFRQAS